MKMEVIVVNPAVFPAHPVQVLLLIVQAVKEQIEMKIAHAKMDFIMMELMLIV